MSNDKANELRQLYLDMQGMQTEAMQIERVHLDLLPPDASLISPAPSHAFVDDIRKNGVMEPCLLREVTSGYTVISGCRRIKAAREAGLTDVPAYVFPAGTDDATATFRVLATNVLRRSNPMAEFEAIDALRQRGYTAAQIGHALDMPETWVEARSQIGRLPPELKKAVYDGEIKAIPATQLARMPAGYQQAAIDLLEQKRTEGKKPRLTVADVRNLKEQRTAEVAASFLPSDMDSIWGAEDSPDNATTWQATAAPAAVVPPVDDELVAVMDDLRTAGVVGDTPLEMLRFVQKYWTAASPRPKPTKTATAKTATAKTTTAKTTKAKK